MLEQFGWWYFILVEYVVIHNVVIYYIGCICGGIFAVYVVVYYMVVFCLVCRTAGHKQKRHSHYERK